MGIAVFAGMLGVTLFGLFLTPVFYVVIEPTGGRVGQVGGARRAAVERPCATSLAQAGCASAWTPRRD